MNRRAQAVVMLLLGGAVTRVSITGTSMRYVKEGLRPVLVVAGLLLVATAVMTLWHDLRPPRDDGALHDGAHDDGAHDDAARADDHGHSHHEPRVGWLLILPAVGLLLVGPPALGAYSATQAGSVLAGQGAGSDYSRLPPGNPARLPVLDYASRAVYDGGKTLTGRTLQLTGFVTPGVDGHPVLVRIVLSCCAADGRPVKVALAGNAPIVPSDTWVTVTGTYVPTTTKDPINDAIVPFLKVTTWQQTTQPAQPYE